MCISRFQGEDDQWCEASFLSPARPDCTSNIGDAAALSIRKSASISARSKMTRQTAERGRISAISRFFNALPLSRELRSP